MQKDRLFPAQEKSEKILKVIRRHWFTYAIFWFLGGALLIPLAIAAIYIIININSINESAISISILISSAYLLSVIGLIMYGFIDFYLDVYILTDKRIVDIKQNGFFNRKISELNLQQVQDVNAEVNGPFATLLHYGNVYIQTAGEKENFIFEAIPHPYETSKNIIDLHQAYLKMLKPEDKKEIDKSIRKIDFSAGENAEVRSPELDEKLLRGLNNTIKHQNGNK